jgi:hypothetical protein
MERWVYDVEVFPNLFCVTFKNIETHEIKVFTIYDNKNDITELEEFLNQEILTVGFNNILYDNAILQYLIQNQDNDYLLEDLFLFSGKIINTDRFGYNPETARYQKPKHMKYKQLDLMKVQAFDKLGVGLKQCAINLKWHKIQDLPYEYDHVVQNWEEANSIILYNLNDVLISEKLYFDIYPQIEMREKLSELYGADLTSASDSKMANIILEHFYTSELNVDIKDIQSLRTKRHSLMLEECIAPNIKFQTNFLKRLHREISNTLVREETNFKYSKSIEFGGVHYDLGIGGLHSADFAAKFVSNDEYEVTDADVASFYPSMMIVNKIAPAHLNRDGFISILSRITKERLEAKKTDKVKADGLKITINSIFGKLGSETFWLQDAKAMLSVTVSGQLYLLMLIEAFVINGIQVISANTDGVVCRIPLSLKDKYREICDWWQIETAFQLEYTKYDLYVRQDVNNYITKKYDGEIKAKGRFLTKIDLKKGYKYPVVPLAMYEYLLNGVPIEKTIREHKNILDFCITQKAGKQFQMEFVHPNKKYDVDLSKFTKEYKEAFLNSNGWSQFYGEDSWLKNGESDRSATTLEYAFTQAWGEHKIKNSRVEILQKNNRYFISNNGGELYKRSKEKNNVIGLSVGNRVTLLNDYFDDVEFEKYEINYEFYIEEAKKFCGDIFENNDYLIPFDDEPEGVVVDYSSKEMKDELLLKLRGIKGLPDKITSGLVKIIQEFDKSKSFLDLLIFAENEKIISSKYGDLIRVGHFKEYGSNKKLYNFFEEFKNGKNKYSSKLSQKTLDKRLEELNRIWAELPDDEYTFREQMEFDMSILGKVVSVFPNVPAKYVYVESISKKYSPKVELRKLRDGKSATMKIYKKYFSKNEFSEGDVLLCESFEKKQKTKMVNDEFIAIPNEFEWWLTSYSRVQNIDKLLSKKENINE